jgi:N-acetylmuramoyl-L-alanine amidase
VRGAAAAVTPAACAVLALAGCGKSLSSAAHGRRVSTATTTVNLDATPTKTATASANAAAGAATTTATSAASVSSQQVARVASTRPPAPPVTKPPIVWDPIPFGPQRRAQMRAYAERHYGLHTYRLIDPHVIVVHYTVTPDFQSTYNTFAPDTPDPELHELPNTCTHFVIDKAGIIHQLVSLKIMCRHTVGLNWTAIGIEHVGYSDWQVLNDPRQIDASLLLVRWLRCRFHIPVRDVIGHNESLTSPYHHEDVPSLRTQTHADFDHADMQVYRGRLRALGGCPRA